MPARRLLLGTVVAALCVTAAVAIVVLLSRSFGDTSARILVTTSAVSCFGLLGVPAGLLLERERSLALARISALLTAGAFLLTLAVAWKHDPGNALWRTWGVLATLALAAAQAGLVEARRRDTDTPAIVLLAACSMVTGAGLAFLGVFAILASVTDSSYYRAVGALAVVDVLLLTLVAILRRDAGPVSRTHRLRVDGRAVEAPGRDFAAAAANAIRAAEREGATVRRIERV